MHDGGETTTTGTNGTDTGGIKVIKRYQNNLRYIKGKKKTSIETWQHKNNKIRGKTIV